MIEYIWDLIEVMRKVWIAYCIHYGTGLEAVILLIATRPIVQVLHQYL